MKVRLAVLLGVVVGLLALAVIPNYVEAITPQPAPQPVPLVDEFELDGDADAADASQLGVPEPELKQVTQGKGHWVNGPRECQVEKYTLHGPKANCSIIIVGDPGREYHVKKYDPARRRYTVTPL